MFGLHVLDIALGLIFVYLLLSIICTTVNEMIAGWLRLRAKNLAEGIENLLRDEKIKDLKAEFYSHPLIKSLSKEGEHPSYIPPRTFTLAFLDILVPAKPDAPVSISEVRKRIESLDRNSDIRRMLLV